MTTTNAKAARRLKARRAETGLAATTRDIVAQWQIGEDGREIRRQVNRAESPVAWLARRKGAGGLPFLAARHLAALERLREDHLTGFGQPGLTLDWQAFGAGGSGPGRRGDDIAAFRLTARRRCEAALAYLGELRGIFERVCLEGTSLALAERGFALPRRQAKHSVRAALDRLADHYRF